MSIIGVGHMSELPREKQNKRLSDSISWKHIDARIIEHGEIESARVTFSGRNRYALLVFPFGRNW